MSHDIRVLLKFLAPDHESIIQPEMQRYARGVATYEMLLKPGVNAYARAELSEVFAGYVIATVEEFRESASGDRSSWGRWCVNV
jgi:hypothetical protein